jgi:signal transduction histidine kinase
MKSLRCRLTLWFAISLLLVVVGLMLAAHWHLDYELRQEKWERTHPAHPDWVLHGSFTDQEVHDILGELAGFWLLIGIPLAGLAIGAAYLIARRSTRPIQQINQQLDRLGAATLSQRIQAPDADPEVSQLAGHFNKLFGRLETSFTHLQEYTAQVAHELRTPLQLLRLRIEANAASMNPTLAEELQEEIARLSNYVETALTIARAEQGRLELKPEPIALRTFLADILEPFSRLAESEGRKLLWSCGADVSVQADRDALKQILFNLLNNALKHGAGNIHLRVKARGRVVRLLLGNSAAQPLNKSATGLGIGLRLVGAFARQMPGARFRWRRRQFFWSQLLLPVAA